MYCHSPPTTPIVIIFRSAGNALRSWTKLANQRKFGMPVHIIFAALVMGMIPLYFWHLTSSPSPSRRQWKMRMAEVELSWCRCLPAQAVCVGASPHNYKHAHMLQVSSFPCLLCCIDIGRFQRGDPKLFLPAGGGVPPHHPMRVSSLFIMFNVGQDQQPYAQYDSSSTD